MDKQKIAVGDDVRHRAKYLNGNMPMHVSDIQNNQALCEHFETNEEGSSTNKRSWFPLEELDKVIYGSTK